MFIIVFLGVHALGDRSIFQSRNLHYDPLDRFLK